MGARILVIEDNPANLELMRYVLGAFGHTVATAIDGLEGLAAARRERPDIIVCDLQLPGIDGFEVARQLKADPVFARVPLVAVTAYAMVGDRERVLAAGFDGYIAKPIEPQNFVEQIDAFLRSEKRQVTPSRHVSEAISDAAGQGVAPTVPANGKYVLILDDTQANIDLLHSILRFVGYETAAAKTVAQARALALRRKPDLILSDFHLHNESGIDFITWVKAQPALANTPFVFISSTVRAETDRKTGLERGADRFILRPIEARALLDQLTDCLAQPGAPAT